MSELFLFKKLLRISRFMNILWHICVSCCLNRPCKYLDIIAKSVLKIPVCFNLLLALFCFRKSKKICIKCFKFYGKLQTEVNEYTFFHWIEQWGFFRTTNTSVAYDGYVGGQTTMNIQVYQEFTQKKVHLA